MDRPLYPTGNTPGTHFCWRLSRCQGHSVTRRIMSMKNSSDTIGNRTSDIPGCRHSASANCGNRCPSQVCIDRGGIYIYICVCVCMYVYRVSQEECARLQEGVPYVTVYRYNPKHLYPKLNGYGDNGQRKVWSSGGSTHCTCQLTILSTSVPECGVILRQFSSRSL